MKKQWALPFMMLSVLMLSGCSPIGEKSSSMTLLYAATAILAALMLLGYFLLEKERRLWFVILFVSVTVVNSGYFLLSISPSLDMALWANRLSYLGSVFLPLAMLMIILNVIGIKPSKILTPTLLGVGALVFLLAASYPLLDWYYKDAALRTVAGATHLDKVYGPLHSVYLFYLIGYFIAMVAAGIYAAVKKRLDTPIRTVILCAAVFINIGVWLVEQLVAIEFEILSISYIITEMFLLGLHLITRENERLKQLVVQQTSPSKASISDTFVNGISQLTQRERTIYDLYLSGSSTTDVMKKLGITENTLKFHNKNIYGKLGVSSRKELLANVRAMQPNKMK